MRKEKKIMAITKAAKIAFLSLGFSDTNMHDIALAAGVSKRTLYHHFPHKTVLFQIVLEEYWQSMLKRAKIKMQENESPKKFLKRFSKGLLTFLYQSETMSFFRLLIAEAERFPNLANTLLKESKAPFTQVLMDYLTHQQKINRLKIKNVSLATSQFMGLLKEDQFWPKLLGFTQEIDKKNINTLIKSAIDVFLSAYQ